MGGPEFAAVWPIGVVREKATESLTMIATLIPLNLIDIKFFGVVRRLSAMTQCYMLLNDDGREFVSNEWIEDLWWLLVGQQMEQMVPLL